VNRFGTIDGGLDQARTGLLRGTGPGFGPYAEKYVGDERTLLHVLRDQVAVRPDQDWLVFDGRDHVTYRQADAGGPQVAGALGVTGRRVALLLRNQREFAPLFVGTLTAGGVVAPMNPELRGPLLATLLGRVDPHVLAIRTDLLPRLDALAGLGGIELVVAFGPGDLPKQMHGVPVVALEDWMAGGGAPPDVTPLPSDLAVLMFTSGTSGGSKAAMWSHHYLFLASACAADDLGHSPDDVLSPPLRARRAASRCRVQPVPAHGREPGHRSPPTGRRHPRA
jgi:carnitine-CoA ligase